MNDRSPREYQRLSGDTPAYRQDGGTQASLTLTGLTLTGIPWAPKRTPQRVQGVYLLTPRDGAGRRARQGLPRRRRPGERPSPRARRLGGRYLSGRYLSGRPPPRHGSQPPPPPRPLCPGEEASPPPLYEHALLGTDPARVKLPGAPPRHHRSPRPPGRQRASRVGEQSSPLTGGGGSPVSAGRAQGEEEESGRRGRRKAGRGQGMLPRRHAPPPGCRANGAQRRGLRLESEGEGEGKEARRQLPRTMAARPPPPSSLPTLGLPHPPWGTRAQAPRRARASPVPAASPPRVSSGAAGGAGAAGRPGGSRAPPAR